MESWRDRQQKAATIIVPGVLELGGKFELQGVDIFIEVLCSRLVAGRLSRKESVLSGDALGILVHHTPLRTTS